MTRASASLLVALFAGAMTACVYDDGPLAAKRCDEGHGCPSGLVCADAVCASRAGFDAGIVLVELSPQRTTLEDRYLSMVQGGSR